VRLGQNERQGQDAVTEMYLIANGFECNLNAMRKNLETSDWRWSNTDVNDEISTAATGALTVQGGGCRKAQLPVGAQELLPTRSCSQSSEVEKAGRRGSRVVCCEKNNHEDTLSTLE
jgi:hypothetical protein